MDYSEKVRKFCDANELDPDVLDIEIIEALETEKEIVGVCEGCGEAALADNLTFCSECGRTLCSNCFGDPETSELCPSCGISDNN